MNRPTAPKSLSIIKRGAGTIVCVFCASAVLYMCVRVCVCCFPLSIYFATFNPGTPHLPYLYTYLTYLTYLARDERPA